MTNKKMSIIVDELLSEMLKGRTDMSLSQIKEKSAADRDWRWFNEFFWTQEEEDAYVVWAIDFLSKKARISKKRAAKEISWFLLYCGLSTNMKNENEDID